MNQKLVEWLDSKDCDQQCKAQLEASDMWSMLGPTLFNDLGDEMEGSLIHICRCYKTGRSS